MLCDPVTARYSEGSKAGCAGSSIWMLRRLCSSCGRALGNWLGAAERLLFGSLSSALSRSLEVSALCRERFRPGPGRATGLLFREVTRDAVEARLEDLAARSRLIFCQSAIALGVRKSSGSYTASAGRPAPGDTARARARPRSPYPSRCVLLAGRRVVFPLHTVQEAAVGVFLLIENVPDGPVAGVGVGLLGSPWPVPVLFGRCASRARTGTGVGCTRASSTCTHWATVGRCALQKRTVASSA